MAGVDREHAVKQRRNCVEGASLCRGMLIPERVQELAADIERYGFGAAVMTPSAAYSTCTGPTV